MIPKSALGFIGFTVWALFFSQPVRRTAKNPSKKRPPSACRKEKIEGGLADYVPDSVFNKKDLAKGIKVEMEHTNDRALAKEIAKDHLLERADYYDRLEEMEKLPVKKKKKKKKNPASGRCLYTMDVSFKRGGKVQKRSLMTEAWTMTEARKKFQDLINKNLRDATLESLHIGVASC